MFITIHSTAAVVIGQSVTNPIGAFFFALASHYLLDIIPHGDEEKFKDIGMTGMAKLAVIDHIGVLLMLASLFVFKNDFVINLNIVLAIIGALLPDWLMAVYQLSSAANLAPFRYINNLIKPLEKFHKFCHHKIIKHEVSFVFGMSYQITTFIILWLLV